ncbi:MAG: YceI family protein [Allomuricauda sp.]|jgi:YceI-like domain
MLSTSSHITKIVWIVSALLIGFGFTDPERETKVRVAPDSEVLISGTTNVNEFTCKYNLEELELPIRLAYDDKAEQIQFSNAQLKLANDCFDCGGKAINKDFRDLLQTEKHPQVELRLLYVDPPKPENQQIGVGMEIKIAGVTRNYETQLYCEQQGNICVDGTIALKLTDFGLEPPRKALGIIKVHDEIKVRIALRLNEI